MIKTSDLLSFVPDNQAGQSFISYISAKVNRNYLLRSYENQFRQVNLHLHLLRAVTHDNSWHWCKIQSRYVGGAHHCLLCQKIL